MSSNLQNSIWPNAGGTLGEIKIQIPTGAANDPWPTGDALVHNFVYQNGKLVGLVDTKALIANESKSTTFPYDYVNIQVDKSLEGVMSFNKGERTKYLIITYTGSSNTGDTIVLGTKYLGCKTVEDVKAVDPDYSTNDIVDGVWSQSFADLEAGWFDWTGMFYNCQNLTTFISDLSSLKEAAGMFGDCHNLTTFSSTLKSLEMGTWMFQNCYNLTSFNSDLSSLTDGMEMFSGCKLDTASVQNIADTINTQGGSIRGNIQIDIGNTTPNEQETAAFNTIASKGWIILSNGISYSDTSPAAITTLDENGEEITTPIPFWAKPVPTDEQHARYVDSEGNFYNILGAQFIYGDNLETYGMFTCEEDAAANMRLTKIEK